MLFLTVIGILHCNACVDYTIQFWNQTIFQNFININAAVISGTKKNKNNYTNHNEIGNGNI